MLATGRAANTSGLGLEVSACACALDWRVSTNHLCVGSVTRRLYLMF